MNVAVSAAAAALLAVYYLGLAPSISSFAFDYTRNIPLSEAIAGVARVSPSALLADPYTSREVWFIPAALAGLAAFVLIRRHRWKLCIAIAATILPLFFARSAWLYAVSPLAFFMAVPAALLGRCDGEDWSEGFIAIGAAGGWILLWILVAATLVWTRKRNR